MRRPSSRVLRNRVNIYVGVSGQDSELAPTFSYPAVPTYSNVACSVQYTDTGLDPEALKRLTMVSLYDVMFAADPHLKPRDKLVWLDTTPNRTLQVESCPPSEAGRGSAWVVRCIEKV